MKLKVGDRIYVYGVYLNYEKDEEKGTIASKTKGTIFSITESGALVNFTKPDGLSYGCNIKQVRKIKERKRIWVNEYDTFLASSRDTRVLSARKAFVHYTKEEADREADNDRVSCTEFVEVKRK